MRTAAPGEAERALLVPKRPMRPKRNHGLDTLRSVAILFVFAYHYQVFVSGRPTFGWISTVGWVGVDLFFVLSGYLIGNQLFAGVASGRSLSLASFYIRRLLRTLPNYYVVLALYFLLPGIMGGKEPPPLWRFVTFTQNIGLQPGTAFSHAWSLCIEEQFYLLLPLLIVAARRFGAGLPIRTAWRMPWSMPRSMPWVVPWVVVVLLGAVGLGIATRSALWFRFGAEAGGAVQGYYPHIYYASFCRIDEFLPGVALALLKNFHPQAWARLIQRGWINLLAALISTGLLLWAVLKFYYIEAEGYGFFMTSFGYSLIACGFGLWVLAALSPSCPLYNMRLPGAARLAAWSYAIYLSHKPIAFVLQKRLEGWQLGEATTAGVIAMGSLLGGWLLYCLVETPFMRLRDRLRPDSFHPASDVELPRSAPALNGRS